MFTKFAGADDAWTGPATAAFEFWASFWPTAPLFGVEWRYADVAGQWNPFTAAGEAAPAAKPAKPRKPARAKAARVAPAAEAAPVEAVAEVAEAMAEVAETVTAGPGVPAALLVAAPEDADDLTAIKGIGAGLARQLNGLGVYKLSQLAGFSQDDLAWIDANLSSFKGRCFRDDWAGQAKALLG